MKAALFFSLLMFSTFSYGHGVTPGSLMAKSIRTVVPMWEKGASDNDIESLVSIDSTADMSTEVATVLLNIEHSNGSIKTLKFKCGEDKNHKFVCN